MRPYSSIESVEEEEIKKTYWTSCQECHGLGKKRDKLGKKARKRFEKVLADFEKSGVEKLPPARPLGALSTCPNCAGSGLTQAENPTEVNSEDYPSLAIIGGGIGGTALAVACLHRGIPFRLYERDLSFDARSQGYGLTLQQASRVIKEFGISSLETGIISTKHVVHTTEGKVIGEWGSRKWLEEQDNPKSKRINVHIPRQDLRFALLNQLGTVDKVQWGHQLVNYSEQDDGPAKLSFQIEGEIKQVEADLIVGADGIRSTVRNQLISEDNTPLHYLGCIVILGICRLANIADHDSDLLDGHTVFQTVNGNERIYMMPFDSESVMWQLSFPMPEEEAKELSKLGVTALKEEACRRTQWHSPIPEIMAATEETLISGYPVYDRALLQPELLANGKQVTLVGDAAHPMSPFKGQGANQALLDALLLARRITSVYTPGSDWKSSGLRETVLAPFEAQMLERTGPKVVGSAEAIKFLHSKEVLWTGDKPRGRRS